MSDLELASDQIGTFTINAVNAAGSVVPLPVGDSFAVASPDSGSLTAAIGKDANGNPAVVLTPYALVSGAPLTLTDTAGLLPFAGTVDVVDDTTPVALSIDFSTGAFTTFGGAPVAGGGTPAPVPANVYPLQMPSGTATGAPVVLGVGADSIVLAMANNPGTGNAVGEFTVIVSQGTTETAVTGPLSCTSVGGENLAESPSFTINGNFPGITAVTIQPVAGTTLAQWTNQLTVDGIEWLTDADAPGVDSRSTGTPNYQSSQVFNSAYGTALWIPPSAVPAAPPVTPAATASTITGATVNGAATTAGTLSAIVGAVPSGGALVLPAGTFVGAAEMMVSGTITGAGMGKTLISGTNFAPVENKSLLLLGVAGITVSNLTLEGASIATSLGNDAAGVRDSANGVGGTLTSVELTGNQDGILTFGSNWSLTGCDIHGNGAGDGLTHEMYFGGNSSPAVAASGSTPAVPAVAASNVVTVAGTTATCGPLATHALKSRAGTTTVSGGTFTGNAVDQTGNIAGSVVDVPDGGLFTATGAMFVLLAGTVNDQFLTYGSESATNAGAGTAVKLNDCVFTDGTGTGGIVSNLTNIPTATLDVTGSTYTATKAPSLVGRASVTGTVAPAPVPSPAAA